MLGARERYRVEIGMPELDLRFIFPKGVSRKRAEELEEKYYYWIIDSDIVIQRAKLKYIPVIEITADLGPPEGKNRESFMSRLDVVCIGFERFAWRWSQEDDEIYGYLKSRFETKVKQRSFHEKGLNVYWPVSVFDDENVKREVELLLNKPLLSAENEDDIELLKESGYWSDEESQFKKELEGKTMEEKKRFIVENMNEILSWEFKRIYENSIKLREEVGSEVWFTLYYSG